jgi:hypothetical protein
MKKSPLPKLLFVFIWLTANTQSGTAQWIPLGSGLHFQNTSAIGVFNSLLYAGGNFSSAGGITANNIATWNGTSWDSVGGGMNNTVSAFATFNNNFYAAGSFTSANRVSANNIVKWTGTTWVPLGVGMTPGGTPQTVNALQAYNGSLYAGGQFTKAGGNTLCTSIARWDGTTWNPLVHGLNSFVYALAVYNGALYAGGSFTNDVTGVVIANRLVKWDGSSYSPLGSGTGMDNTVYALAVDSVNHILYAGGTFANADGVAVNYIAQWNGTSWSGLGSGMNGQVQSLVFNNGILYAAGLFTTAGGISANYVAAWNGTSWSALGTGTNNYTFALDFYNGNLYAGGQFSQAGGVSASCIAEWKSAATGIVESTSAQQLILSPNPSTNYVNIETPSAENQLLSLFNDTGELILTQVIQNGRTTLDVSTLAPGMYNVCLTSCKQIFNKRLIIIR